jgi:hypothetical protein
MMDVLFTLSALFIMGSTLLPMTVQLMMKSNQLKADHLATTLLYEKLQLLIITKHQPEYQVFEKNSVQYEIIPILIQKEVCIQFEDYTKSKKRICAYWE